MKIATWNINSVRHRLHKVLNIISDKKIDLLCLQETTIELTSIKIKNFKASSFMRKL
jgi:exonuclease III